MRAELFTKFGERQLGYIDVPSGPVCGQDFCELCEDCMDCFPCSHPRIVYEDELEQFLDDHEDATVHLEES